MHRDFDDVARCGGGSCIGAGKSLLVETLILTTGGWRRLGDLTCGDQVFDDGGKPCTITEVSDQPLTDTCYEVIFSDGTVLVADDAHLWWTAAHAPRAASTSDRVGLEGPSAAWLTPTVTGRLRAEAARAHPGTLISLAEVAVLADINADAIELHDLAKTVRPAREQRSMQRSYHYARKQFRHRQTVTLFPGAQLCDYLAGCAQSSEASDELLAHRDALLALCARYRGDAQVAVEDIATGLRISPLIVYAWLANAPHLPSRKDVREVSSDVPQRTVEGSDTAITLYPKAALLRMVAARGDEPLKAHRQSDLVGKVRSTREIRESLFTVTGEPNHSIPVCKPLQYPDAVLPISPYIFGSRLGDGASVNGPNATGISRRYLEASEKQRRALLAGLLDTSGRVSADGIVEFVHINADLAKDVRELARGLGYQAVLNAPSPQASSVQVRTHTFVVAILADNAVFRTPRRQLTHDRRGQAPVNRLDSRSIVDVRPTASTPMRCIRVDAASQQCLVGQALIASHNPI